mmetsp:Transcript_10484/g.15059  ORF Transcript_10484/g.15059 Transcript_10484/m.15059 type:complete len:87 (+) Transcript_10484:88-348(+)
MLQRFTNCRPLPTLSGFVIRWIHVAGHDVHACVAADTALGSTHYKRNRRACGPAQLDYDFKQHPRSNFAAQCCKSKSTHLYRSPQV